MYIHIDSVGAINEPWRELVMARVSCGSQIKGQEVGWTNI